jgi:hypothetical protein
MSKKSSMVVIKKAIVRKNNEFITAQYALNGVN